VGDVPGATAAFREGLRREPRHLGASRALARVLARQGQNDEAVRLLEEAAQGNPGSPLPHIDLAMLLESGGDRPGAARAYRAALARDERAVPALNNLAYLLGEDEATRDEALRLAERAYQRAPRTPAIVDTLGWLLYLTGDLERAEQLLARAATGAPDNPRIRYHLGMTYAKRGKSAEARRELETALQAKGGFPEADLARRTLESLPK
jgi:Flp pilus assembly protein TadD